MDKIFAICGMIGNDKCIREKCNQNVIPLMGISAHIASVLNLNIVLGVQYLILMYPGASMVRPLPTVILVNKSETKHILRYNMEHRESFFISS